MSLSLNEKLSPVARTFDAMNKGYPMDNELGIHPVGDESGAPPCDDQYIIEGVNPTVALIFCSGKDEVVAKYSMLSDRKQIFASKYMQYLPSEEILAAKVMRAQRLFENLREGEGELQLVKF